MVIKRNKLGQFIKGSQKGPQNPRWKGGRTVDKYGYIKILKPDSPMADANGYVYLHRFKMSQKLNRILKSNEIVHHINENRIDNRIKNLQLLTESQHKSIHGKNSAKSFIYKFDKKCIECGDIMYGVGIVRKYCNKCKTKKCFYCKKEFISEPASNRKYCSPECTWKAQIGKPATKKQLEGLKKRWK